MPDLLVVFLLVAFYAIGFADGRGSALDHVPFWRGWNDMRLFRFWPSH
jgi:hypothetical protein